MKWSFLKPFSQKTVETRTENGLDRSEIDAVADRNLAILETMFLKMNRGPFPLLFELKSTYAFIPVNIYVRQYSKFSHI